MSRKESATKAKRSAVKTKELPRTKKSRPKSWVESWCTQREAFYSTHPRARFLIGILIVALAICVGVVIRDWREVYVGLELDKYDIEYPYVEPAW